MYLRTECPPPQWVSSHSPAKSSLAAAPVAPLVDCGRLRSWMQMPSSVAAASPQVVAPLRTSSPVESFRAQQRTQQLLHPCADSEDERSPPSSPSASHTTTYPGVVAREDLHKVSLLSNAIRYLSHKAQTEGLFPEERALLEGQLATLESMIEHLNLPRPPVALHDYVAALLSSGSSSSNNNSHNNVNANNGGLFSQTSHHLLLPSLLQAAAAAAADRPASPPSADDQAWAAGGHHARHPGVLNTSGAINKGHKKRAKRTFNRACVHCNTQFTSQWRKGPAGASTLCNACGIRYARRLKKDAKAKALAAQQQPASSPATTPTNPTTSCHEASRRSTVYALLN